MSVEEDLDLLRVQVGQLQRQLNQLASPVTAMPPAAVQSGPTTNPGAAAGAGAAAPAVRLERNWRAMSAPQADLAWTQLVEFIDWLTGRYELDNTLPACWYRHGPFVEELNALQILWTATYTNPAAKALEPMQFHNSLGQARLRLRGWNRYGCAASSHHESQPVRVDDNALIERQHYLQGDVCHRARHDGAPFPGTP